MTATGDGGAVMGEGAIGNAAGRVKCLCGGSMGCVRARRSFEEEVERSLQSLKVSAVAEDARGTVRRGGSMTHGFEMLLEGLRIRCMDGSEEIGLKVGSDMGGKQ